MRHLGEPGVGERAAAADVQLAPGDLLAGPGDHRIALQRARTTVPRVVHRSRGECRADAAPAEPGPGDKAGDRPDAVVIAILVPSGPDDPAAAQVHVHRPRLDSAPAGRLPV